MIKKLTFKKGDLIREKSYLTDTKGYGIIVSFIKLGKDQFYKCLWSNEEFVWLKPDEIYLISRGQNGQHS
jgi:hypothetical protein